MAKKKKEIEKELENNSEEIKLNSATEEQSSTNGKDKKETEMVQKKEYDQLNDKHLRLYAEFENYKRRTVKERLDLLQTAAKETIIALLPVLDDFDRAKASADDDSSQESFSEGVQLVYEKLYRILEQQGLQPMETTGEPFDAEYHEAITEIPAPSEDMKGKIIDTVEKGYFLKDKIIRHAKVVVGK